MANRADAYVKNGFTTGNINVIRKLADGSIDMEVPVAPGSEEMVHLPSPAETLFISAPTGADFRYCQIKKMRSDTDLAITWSRTDSIWAIKIIPNDLPPDAPTTLNVEVGPTGE